jgi:hypothetical protein
MSKFDDIKDFLIGFTFFLLSTYLLVRLGQYLIGLLFGING